MYTALYRKWRPKTFDDVISQPHITTTLQHQIAENKTAHAYLFTGSRGTGKTTCARIFAKAINCLNPHDGKPCLECDICRAAENGTLNDIIEIDAASNTGVDDIRELRESAIYTPELCRYKVYIIDEVHMLSNQAFNALLKIMEEPPEHVKFILATTEIYKVPATIISRCQRFDFRRIRPRDISDRLLYIADKEGVTLSEDAAAAIAEISDGAMRDALSLLDQCIAYSDNISADTVSDAAGIAGREYLFEILDAISDSDAAKVLKIIDFLYSRSKDMARLCDELVLQLRNVMLIITAPENEELLSCLPSERDRLIGLSKKLSLDDVLKQLEILQAAGEAMQRAVSKRTEFEMAAIKLCRGYGAVQDSNDTSAIEKRISALEKRLDALIKSGAAVKSYSQKNNSQRNDSHSQRNDSHSQKVPSHDAGEPSHAESVEKAKNPAGSQQPLPVNDETLKPFDRWDEVLKRLTEVNPGCAGALKGSKGRCCGNTLLIEVQSEFFLNLFKKPENAASLRDVVKEITGVSYSLRARCVKEKEKESETNDRLSQLIEQAKKADIPFDID